MSERAAFPTAKDPGALFRAPEAAPPQRSFLSASAADGAAPKPSAFGPEQYARGTGQDVEMVAPRSAPGPVDETSIGEDDLIVEWDPSIPIPESYQAADQVVAPVQDEAPPIDEGRVVEQAQQPIDISQHPDFQRMQQEVVATRQREALTRQHEAARAMQADAVTTQQRRAALFRALPSLDHDQTARYMAAELQEADRRVGHWQQVAADAIGYVNWIQTMADTARHYGLTEAEAMQLAQAPPQMVAQQADFIVRQRNQANSEVDQLRAEVARLKGETTKIARRQSIDPRAHAVGGGTSGAPATRRVKAGTDEHLAAIMGFGRRR